MIKIKVFILFYNGDINRSLFYSKDFNHCFEVSSIIMSVILSRLRYSAFNLVR